jgi:hypothetical protein
MKFLFSKEEGGGTEEKDPIADAAKEVDKTFKAEGVEEETKEEETKEEPDKEDEEEKEEEEDKDKLTPEQLAHATNIFKALQNPESAKATVEALAKLSGVELKEVETKKEEKEVVKTVKDYVKEELEKYPFLADAIGNILEKAIPNIVKEQQKELAEKIERQEERELQARAAEAQDKVLSEFNEVKVELLQEVLRIQEEGELRPGAKSTNEGYFRACLRMASDNLKIPLEPKSSKTETREKAKPNPLNNLHKSGNRSEKEGVEVAKPLTIKNAIELAIEQVEAKSKKA